MKTNIVHFAKSLCLCALLVPGLAFAQAPAATGPTPTGTLGATPRGQHGRGERHPVMRRAIHELQRVREQLAHDAAHDFQGHRVTAIGSIDQAIAALQAGIASDKQ